MITVKLLRPARINHEAGDIVEVSPAQFGHLISTGSAELVGVETPEEKKPARKTAKK